LHIYPSPLKIGDKSTDALFVRRIDKARFPQVPLSLGTLFCQNMIGKGLIPDNFTCTRGFKSFCSTTIRLYLGHFQTSYVREEPRPLVGVSFYLPG
jgi:hypothetical protein